MVQRKQRVWQWKQGANVTLDYDPECRGVITNPGDEVSEVKFLNGTRQFIPNRHLIPED